MTPIQTVKKVVCKRYGVTDAQLCWKTRGPKEWSWPRQVAMWICVRQELGSHEEIASSFNRIWNDTVYAYNKVQSDVMNYPFLRKEVDDVLNLAINEMEL
jgi:chromosomal replication initiation ATPase DnaA